MKTNELTGAALDWAVSKALQPGYEDWRTTEHVRQGFNPSTDWAQGGPIIERERISVGTFENEWSADVTAGPTGFVRGFGPTPLIAAMRCYVASTLGAEVELPEGLQ